MAVSRGSLAAPPLAVVCSLIPDDAAVVAMSAYLTFSAQGRRPLGSEGFVAAALERIGAAPSVAPSDDAGTPSSG